MRVQKVSVDVWKVIITALSCLVLAFMAWVFLRLAYACVLLPGYLKRQNKQIDKHFSIQEQKLDLNGDAGIITKKND